MLFLITIVAVVVTTTALECPPKDKVHPCSCDEDRGLTVISCEGFDRLAEIEPVVRDTTGYNVSFSFFRSNLGDIPSDFFKDHNSVKLHFENCVIGSFGDTPFSGLEDSLEILNIFQSIDKSTRLDSFRLNHLQNLKYFFSGYNDIEEVGNHWFEGGPVSLRQVNFGDNKIERVGEKAFASLINLEQVFMNGNQFKAVARSMISNPAEKLWVLEVRSNNIEELPADAFEGYPNLRILNLSNNHLKSIPENIWSKIWSQLKSVSLAGNEIVCDENLKWIYSQKLPDTFEGKCGPGNDLHNKDLNSLKLDDFR